jgi:chromate reductase, NAD(P)H dehydrogenase (quinone)
VRVLGISGSLRRGSHNRRLLRAAGDVFAPGADLVEWDALGDLPVFDEDIEEPAPEPVRGFRAALEASDAVLVATPEYNHSIPGGLKNALDWASRPFPDNALRDRPVVVTGASTGLFGAVWAQSEVRKVLAAAGARVLDEELPVGTADTAFTPDGRLADPGLAARLEHVLGALAAAVDERAAQPA